MGVGEGLGAGTGGRYERAERVRAAVAASARIAVREGAVARAARA